MRSILTCLLLVPLALAGCVVGSDEDGTGLGGGGGGGGGGSGVAGSITANASWTGTVKITGATTIEAGITVSVDPGTTIDIAPGAGVTVKGTLTAAGTQAAPITIEPEGGTGSYSPFSIQSGGTIQLTYVKQTGGGINLSTGGSAVIADTYMSKVSGDFLVMNGGSLDMQYSQLGVNPGETDTTHCNLHINGATSIKVNYSNIDAVAYGLMFYGGTGADFTNNNWFGNTKDVDSSAGVQGDFTGSWFEDGAPTPVGGANLTLTGLAAAKLTAGPR